MGHSPSVGPSTPQGLTGMRLTCGECSLNTGPDTQWELSQHWTCLVVGALLTQALTHGGRFLYVRPS